MLAAAFAVASVSCRPVLCSLLATLLCGVCWRLGKHMSCTPRCMNLVAWNLKIYDLNSQSRRACLHAALEVCRSSAAVGGVLYIHVEWLVGCEVW